MPPKEYVELILQEIRQRNSGFKDRELKSVYFGGGTPSLIEAGLIVSILAELANVGFTRTPDCEITIEINPATMDQEKLEVYLDSGINRFSVGAQTFDDRLLALCGRKHSARDTRETLSQLDGLGLNYSFDLLFALPGQTLEGLGLDLTEALRFRPRHLSAYCLTVPEGHPMATGRAPEAEQLEMFRLVEDRLAEAGFDKYEISNFALPGYESRHNLSYWSDLEYWGLGLSAHSYSPELGNYGTRYWNPKDFPSYTQQVMSSPGGKESLWSLPPSQFETLEVHEALTDYCHMFLRVKRGLLLSACRDKFGVGLSSNLESRLVGLVDQGLLHREGDRYWLTETGQNLSNQVFLDLTYTAPEVARYHVAPFASRQI